ncbi:MAG: class D sortase [Acidobacteriia bacterium]|nr:class D sortase [Terriglobia bacterium]
MNATRRTPSASRRLISIGLCWASYFFLLTGVLAASYAGYVLLDAQVYQAIELRKFKLHVPLAEPHLRTIGEAVGQIEIPSVGIRAIVLHGDSPGILRRGVGHLPETPMPGEWGNVALAGHRDTFFRPLHQIRTGDVITLETSSGSYRYRVESTEVVPPTNTEVLRPSNRRELTLITCFPFDYVGPAPKRFIVRAIEVGASPE